jgi:hypothetical protein
MGRYCPRGGLDVRGGDTAVEGGKVQVLHVPAEHSCRPQFSQAPAHTVECSSLPEFALTVEDHTLVTPESPGKKPICRFESRLIAENEPSVGCVGIVVFLHQHTPSEASINRECTMKKAGIAGLVVMKSRTLNISPSCAGACRKIYHAHTGQQHGIGFRFRHGG